MATVGDFICFKANCTETALFIKLYKPPKCDVNNVVYYHKLIRLSGPRALIANIVYSINALTKTIDFELFSSLLLPKGNSLSVEGRRNAELVLSNKEADDEDVSLVL